MDEIKKTFKCPPHAILDVLKCNKMRIRASAPNMAHFYLPQFILRAEILRIPFL